MTLLRPRQLPTEPSGLEGKEHLLLSQLSCNWSCTPVPPREASAKYTESPYTREQSFNQEGADENNCKSTLKNMPCTKPVAGSTPRGRVSRASVICSRVDAGCLWGRERPTARCKGTEWRSCGCGVVLP